MAANDDDTNKRERIYDEQIAPLLLKAGQLCEQHGMPMLATVWFGADDTGTTRVPPTEANSSWTLAHAAHQCRGNIDSLVIGLARSVAPENDGSIVLRMIRGRADKPEAEQP